MTNQAHALAQLVQDGLDRGFLLELPSEAAERLLAEAIRIDVPAGAVVYREDESPRVLVVVSGLLRVFMSSDDGRQVTVRYVRRGGQVGLAMVTGGPAPWTVQSLTIASVVALRVDTLRSMFASDPITAQVCAGEISRLLYEAVGSVAENAFLSVRQRIARLLLDLAERSDGPHLVVRMSHQELADAVASVREVVTRTLHQMRADGLVETARDQILLLDPARLHDEVEPAEE